MTLKELCHKLKEKRREFGYSIEEVVEKTKLHPSVIHNIEEASVEKINPTYLKGFLKIYASFLGVDTGSCLEELSSEKTSLRHKEDYFKNKSSSFHKRKLRKDLPFLPNFIIKPKKIILILVAVLFIIFIISFFRGLKKTQSSGEKKTHTEKKTPSPTTKRQLSPPTFKKNKKTNLPKVKGQILTLTAKRDVFIRIKSDGLVLFEGVLKKGSTETWQAKEKIEVSLKDGSAVEVEANGKILPPLTTLHKPIKKLIISSSGISVEK